MKIILLKSIKNLGQAGEIKEVSDGYARNFLIPQGLANMATKYSLSVTEAQKRKRKRLRNQAKRAKEKLAQKINGQKFVFKTKADEKGTLYAKFDNKVIAHKLKEKGVNVEATEIDLSQSIKKIGEYKLHLKLGSKSATIKLKVES